MSEIICQLIVIEIKIRDANRASKAPPACFPLRYESIAASGGVLTSPGTTQCCIDMDFILPKA